MTKKKYIDWVLTEEKTKTDVFTVFSKSNLEELAEIKWYPRWRQYCIIIGDTVWSEGCWDELGSFLREAKAIYKERKAIQDQGTNCDACYGEKTSDCPENCLTSHIRYVPSSASEATEK